MLMRFDPFREFDRISGQVLGSATRFAVMPMDAYRDNDKFVVEFDLPGVDPASIELTVEKNVLTVSAERQRRFTDGQQVVASERPQGSFSRQLFLGEALDSEQINAGYDNGVLTVTVPIAEQAKPRKVQIASGSSKAKQIESTTAPSKESSAA